MTSKADRKQGDMKRRNDSTVGNSDRTQLGLTAVACLGVIAMLACTPSAVAKKHRREPHPAVSWSLPRSANEGTSIPFSWSGRHLGRKHRLVIQQPVGTAHIWKTIMKLGSNSGSAELPGMPLGKYRLRIADLAGHRVLARKVAGVGVFGQVPFLTLFKTSNYEIDLRPPGVYTTPSASFPYASSFDPGAADSPNTAFTVEHNHCVAVHMDFVPSHPELDAWYNPSTVSGAVTVVQEASGPVSASAPYDGIGTLDAALAPGQSWSVNVSYQGEFQPSIYLNGYAVCDSTDSFFS
jgi:hypothetical protein